MESWLIREIIPKWPYFRLVKYYNLPTVITEISRILRQRAPSSAPLAEAAGLSAGQTAAVGEGGSKWMDRCTGRSLGAVLMEGRSWETSWNRCFSKMDRWNMLEHDLGGGGGEIALLYCPLPGTGMIGSAHGRNWWFRWTSSSLGNLLFESFLSSELLKTLKVCLARHSTDLRKGRPSTLDPSRHLKTPGTLWVTLCWPWFAPGPFFVGCVQSTWLVIGKGADW